MAPIVAIGIAKIDRDVQILVTQHHRKDTNNQAKADRLSHDIRNNQIILKLLNDQIIDTHIKREHRDWLNTIGKVSIQAKTLPIIGTTMQMPAIITKSENNLSP